MNVLNNRNFCWFGQRALDCIGLDRFLNFNLIICCDYGMDTELVLSTSKIAIFSLERETGIRERWDNFGLERLLEGTVGSRVFSELLNRVDALDIVAYCSTQSLERVAEMSGGQIRILAARTFLKQFFDSKITLRAVLPALGIIPIPGHVTRLGMLSFREMSRIYETPFVIQFPVGSGGHCTFFVSTEAELLSLARDNPHQDVIVSKYIRGPSPNINAVVLDHSVVLSYPSVQLIGIEECTNWPAGYCGNDFSATDYLSDVSIQEIYRQTHRIGSWLRQHGFRGFFGVDFVMDDTHVYPVEVNPRFQGSTQMLTQLQIMRDEIPLALAHTLHFIDKDVISNPHQVPLHWCSPNPLQGSQIVLHSKEDTDSQVRGALIPGVYAVTDQTIAYRREGLSLSDCQNEDEFIVNCAVPHLGTLVQPGAPLLKIQTLRRVLEKGAVHLSAWASHVCKWAYQNVMGS
jgi:hypothetical protein